MMTIHVPWRAWYGDTTLAMGFPDGWRVAEYRPDDGPDIGDEAIEAAFDAPIGARPIEDLAREAVARGNGRVAIAVDDISRPAPTARMLPPLLRRLERAGVHLDRVRVVLGTGAHRAMTRDDIVKKLGREVADRLDVHNNNPYDYTADLGVTSRGTPVRICRFLADADLKIGVGSITPHGGPGFGGGAKVVVPGCAGIETIKSMHWPGRLTTGLGRIEGNELRADIEEMVRDHLKLDWIVNAVVNSRRGIAGLFVGDLVAAHRAGVALGRRVFATDLPPEPVDVIVCNAYPKDTDFLQHANALNLAHSAPWPLVRPGGTVVVATACPEGRGVHGVYGPGMCYDSLHDRAEGDDSPRTIWDAPIVTFSPELSANDVRAGLAFRRWEDLISYLGDLYAQPSVAVFPCASIQLARAA